MRLSPGFKEGAGMLLFQRHLARQLNGARLRHVHVGEGPELAAPVLLACGEKGVVRRVLSRPQRLFWRLLRLPRPVDVTLLVLLDVLVIHRWRILLLHRETTARGLGEGDPGGG